MSPTGGRRIHQDVVSGGVLLALSAAYGLGAIGLPPGDGEPGPAFLPLVLGGTLAILSLGILWGGLRAGGGFEEVPPTPGSAANSLTPGGKDVNEEHAKPASVSATAAPHSTLKPWLAIGMTGLYAVLFQLLGFSLSTLAYTFAITLLFERRWRRLCLIPLLVTLALYVLFSFGLGVRLPGGPW